MKINKLIKNVLNLAVATTTSLSLQVPAKADYQPNQNVYLEGFGNALRQAGFEYGGYSKLPYCFNTTERIDGTVPIVVVCPLETGKRNSNYAVSGNDTVSAIWMSMLVDDTASQELNRRAADKADLVAAAFLKVRYNVTSSSFENIVQNEVVQIYDGNGTSYVNSSGNSCRKKVSDLTYVGAVETTVCSESGGTKQVTIWF